jgi:UDP-N-acetyl-D-mannosaminuronic acid dehydrogenase
MPMHSVDRLILSPEAPLRQVLERFDAAAECGLPAGIVLVVDERRRLVGTVTEGDVRRALLGGAEMTRTAAELMQPDPIAFPDDISIVEILNLLPEELALRGRRSKKFLGKIILVDELRRPTRVLDYHQLWEQRVATHRHVVVVGLGYVGLTLGLVLADQGFLVTGIDVDGGRVAMLNAGRSYVHEAGLQELLERHHGRNFRASIGMPDDGDVYVIAVGTPVEASGGHRQVAMEYLHTALDWVAARLRPGNLVVLRSTVPVGTCRSVVIPRLEQRTGLRCGIDFHLSFAPERTAEGRALQELRELPQIIGGYNADSVEATAALFRELATTIVRVDSLEAAEMAKLINNSFRDLVFAFSNQATQLASRFDIDIVEVIKAANQGYPRDPVPLPSPGVGGPCLTKDPYIMAAAQAGGLEERSLFEQGRAVNDSMCDFAIERVLEQLVRVGKEPSRCRVLACGLAFKGHPETGDLRDSTGVAIALGLGQRVAEVWGYDPVVPGRSIEVTGLRAADLPGGFDGMDAVLFLNNHRSFEKFDLAAIKAAMAPRPIIFDGWHQFRSEDVLAGSEAVYLGLSFVRSSVMVADAVVSVEAQRRSSRDPGSLQQAQAIS